MSEYAKILKESFPEYPLATWTMPVFVLWLASFFDRRLTPEFLDEAGKVFSNAIEDC